MDESPIPDLSFERTPNPLGVDEGYGLWFDLPPHARDATTAELQTLCQGTILLGRIAQEMGWDWATLIRSVEHLSAPSDGFLLVEVGSRLFASERFRRALHDAVPTSGLDPYKVKVADAENANAYILGHGLPPI